MNRQTKINAQNTLNQKELELGYSGDSKKSWHQVYKDSAWIYVGGLDYELNEGDILSVFSQYGEIMNVIISRDYKTLKSKGFAWVCYKDQRSTNLAVDNFNGIRLANRLIAVDHCKEFRPPKFKESVPSEILKMWEEGCAPKPINVSKDQIDRDVRRQEEERNKAMVVAEQLLDVRDKDAKKMMKKAKKEAKKAKKEEKRRKRLEREAREQTPDEERGRADDEGRWDERKRKQVDYRGMEDEDFYGSSEHFNFNKKRKELPAGPTHNIRPDFDNADWRDIELFKIMREKEREEKGEKPNFFKEEEHYVPSRVGK